MRVLNKRDTSRTLHVWMANAARTPSPAPPARGILRAPPADGLLEARRLLPSAKLARYVHHFWSLRWALRSPFVAEALPHPSAQILCVATSNELSAEVRGVHTGRLTRCLTGEGESFGITFRPGMFQPLWAAPMSKLTDRALPLEAVFGAKSGTWVRELVGESLAENRLEIVEKYLEPLLPAPSSRLAGICKLVERMASDRSLLRVEDVVELSGLELRALQRAFRTYIGVSPKWVIQRYRLHEAAAQLTGLEPPPLAALAASLGYADQAHFARDFKRAVGSTPRCFGRPRLPQ